MNASLRLLHLLDQNEKPLCRLAAQLGQIANLKGIPKVESDALWLVGERLAETTDELLDIARRMRGREEITR